MMKRRIGTALIALLTCMMVGACGSRSGGVDRSELLENLKDSVAAAKTSGDETDSVAAASTSEDEATGTDSDELPESISNLIEEEAYSEALEQLDAYLAEHENSVEGHIERAKARVLASETAEAIRAAIDDYAKAHELSPENSEAVYGLADMYIRQNDFETAQKVIEESLKSVQEDEGVKDLLKSLTSGNVKDGLGRPHKMVYRDGDGHVLGYITYAYGEDGRTTNGTGYDENGEAVLSVDYEYDGEGRYKKMLSYGLNESSIEYYLAENEYQDNEDGYIQTEKRTTTSGSVRRDQMVYGKDKSGNCHILSSQHVYENGKPGDLVEFVYDDNDRLVRQNYYQSSGSLVSYEIYERDEQGLQRGTYYIRDGDDYVISRISITEQIDNYRTKRYTYYYDLDQNLYAVTLLSDEDGEISLDIDQVEDPIKKLLGNQTMNDLSEESPAED